MSNRTSIMHRSHFSARTLDVAGYVAVREPFGRDRQAGIFLSIGCVFAVKPLRMVPRPTTRISSIAWGSEKSFDLRALDLGFADNPVFRSPSSEPFVVFKLRAVLIR